jgi:beta-lactamase regulating signal transducer with metallopeptidase domain
MEQVFLSVLRMSITASYAILFVLFARLLLKKAPKIFSYSLWSVVLFRLVYPFSFSSSLSLFRFMKHDTMEYFPANIVYTPQVQANPGFSAAGNVVKSSLSSGSKAVPLAASASLEQVILSAVSFIWIIGVVSLIIYSLLSYVVLKRRISTAMLISENIFESEKVESPFVLGIITPKIYLPIRLTESELGYILMHEQTHIKRFDYLIKPIAFLVLCFHWFNPLVWISFVLMSRDMEMSCDERVLNGMGRNIKRDYSNSLLALATHKKMINGNPLAFGETNVKSRIKNVLKYKKSGFWVIAAAAILVGVVVIGLITNPKNNKQDLLTSNVSSEDKAEVTITGISSFAGEKIYKIPSKLRKDSYSVEDFKTLLSKCLELNSLEPQTSPGNDKIIMPVAEKFKYNPYDTDEITPRNVKEEVGCQIFKVHNETYLVYNSKIYEFQLPINGFGVVSIETCDFDDNGQKDLIYTYSLALSGIGHNYIVVFDLTNERQERLDFDYWNHDIMLEKISDSNFKIYTAEVTIEKEQDFVHFKALKEANVAEVKSVSGKIEVIKYSN